MVSSRTKDTDWIRLLGQAADEVRAMNIDIGQIRTRETVSQHIVDNQVSAMVQLMSGMGYR